MSDDRPPARLPDKIAPSSGTRPAGQGQPSPAGWPEPGGRAAAATTSVRERASAPAPRRGPRRARLAVRRVDPWSVLKVTFVYALALVVVFVVAVVALYLVLTGMGVFDSVDRFLSDISGGGGPSVGDYLSFGKVVGGAAVLGGINVVLFTALATLGAVVYNLCAALVGGVEVTLGED